MNNDKPRRIRVRAVVAYPAVSVAIVVSVALVLNPFSASQVMALTSEQGPSATPTPSSTPSSTSTTTSTTASSPSPKATPSTNSSTTTSTSGSLTASPSPTPSPAPGPSPKGIAAPVGVPVDHHVLAWIGSDGKATYFPIDSPMVNASQFQTIRVRFTVHNAGTAAMTAAPQLEYRPSGTTGYTVVPEKPVKGIPLQVVREWVPSQGGGTRQGPVTADIAVAKFLTGNGGDALAMVGRHSMGANPAPPITLPSDSYTEQEFTVRLTLDARSRAGYDLRITDGHTLLSLMQVAKISLGAPPAMRLTPGQRNGLAVKSPKAARGTGTVK